MYRKTRRVRTALALATTMLLGSVASPVAAHALGLCPSVVPDGAPNPVPPAIVDWSGCDLTGANLSGADLRWANLSGATLTGANLSRTDLSQANLFRALGTGVNFTGAVLSGTKLHEAAITGANFTDAVGRVSVDYADLSGSTFTRAILAGSTLTDVQFKGSTFTGANLSGANLYYAGFGGTQIRSTDLSRTNLRNAFWVGATLDSVDLSGSDLVWGHLSGATVSNTRFDQANLWNANLQTMADAGGNTWAGATCPDGKLANVHYDVSCLREMDTSPPRATPTVTGPGTGVGHWYTGPVTIHWNWRDYLALSPDICPSDTSGVSLAGTVTATCTDPAGNVGTASFDVRFDQVPPSLSATVSHAPNGLNGWWRTAPTVNYTCSDTGSGIARCPGPVTAPQGIRTLTVTAADVAGNTATNGTPVKVDTVKPAVAVNLATLNSYGAQVPKCVATDATSGVATCRVTTTTSTTVNYRYATATATDKAGNVAVSAKVAYRATTVAAFKTAPSSVTRGAKSSVVITSKNAKGALINLTGVRALLPVKTTSTGTGPVNMTLSTYATRIGTGTYKITFTAPRTSGYYRYAVRVGNATATKVIRVS